MKMKTGERIKLVRKEKHISAEEIAAAANVSTATIYRYENGEIAEVPEDKVAAIADALDTTVPFLTGRLKRNLHALDIEIRNNGSAGVELVDTKTPGVSVQYSKPQWTRLQERNDFRKVWRDLHSKEEKFAEELKGDIAEIYSLCRSLTYEQREQVKSYIRFVKSGGR